MKKKHLIGIVVLLVVGVICMILCKKFCHDMGCCENKEDSFTPV